MYKIIVAEDEYFTRKGLIETINWTEINCSIIAEAKNGMEAFDLIKKHQPQIVITDIKMPKCDGLQLIEKCHSAKLETEFIILSGYDDFEYAQTAIRLNVNDYILKPVDDVELISAIINIQSRLHNAQTNKLPKIYQDFINQIDKITETNHLLINKVTQFIKLNINTSITINDIATHLDVSSGHLSRRFKQTTGYTLNEYITSIRLYQSIELLFQTNKTIQQIANEVGYSDSKYFSSLFYKEFNENPSDFRNSIKQL